MARHVRLSGGRREFEGALPRKQDLDGAHIERVGSRGTVYFVRIGDRIKVGWTSDFTRRKNTLATEFGPVTVLALARGTLKDEAKIHQKFSALLIPGKKEWFRPDPSIIGFIDQMVEQGVAIPGSVRYSPGIRPNSRKWNNK